MVMTIISVALFLFLMIIHQQQRLIGEMFLVLHLCGADTSTLTEHGKITTLKYVKLPLDIVSAFYVATSVYSCILIFPTVDAIVDIRIESNGTDVDGHNISVYQGKGLAKSIDCSIKPDNAGVAASLTWKHGNGDVPTVLTGQSFGIYQVNKNGIQQLYINNSADSDDGIYSCQASDANANLLPKSFTLHFNGILLFVRV